MSNCSPEILFAALKIIKSYLKQIMTDDHLNRLEIFSIESALTIDMKFDDIINTFAIQNSRKKLYIFFKFYSINI